MARGLPHIEHLLRRAGFGSSARDNEVFGRLSTAAAISRLIDFESIPDDVDDWIGHPDYVGVTSRGTGFSPFLNIEDARQRWLFRMVHTQRPLQEKMALFWHNHFATAFSKVAGIVGAAAATKLMANKRDALPGPPGQIELFREMGLGRFRDLLVAVARDPAMLFWLDNRTNTRQRPQENFAREIMELFTIGVGNFTEQDVYAAARVFTGWNVRFTRAGDDASSYYQYVFNPNQHETSAKAFTFPIYPDGSTVIPARAAGSGEQDGLDFIAALARHPETARRLARKLWNFFVSEVVPPEPEFVNGVVQIYLQSDTDIRAVVHYIFRSRQFQNLAYAYTRFAWPIEFVVRALKEVGWSGYSVDAARTPLTQMGQTLFEPPDVNGWDVGPAWFTSGAMLARMNFAASLSASQRFNLGRAASAARSSPEDFLSFFLDRLSPASFDREPYDALLEYLRSGAAWTGSDAQLPVKASGLTRLIVGSSEYQLM